MHGQFYNHYANQQSRTSQNPSNSARTTNEQQVHALYRAQHNAVVNGQAYPTHANQQQQPRVQPTIQHGSAAGLTSQQYNQLLQSHAYYLTQQQQQQTRQQEQQRLLQQQQQQVASLDAATLRSAGLDPTTLHNLNAEPSLRTLLATSYGRNTLSQMQMQTLNHLSLSQASVSPHRVGSNAQPHLEHIQPANKLMSQSRIMTSQSRELPRQHESAVNQAPPPLRNIQAQNASQAALSQEMLMARHLSPTAPGRSPPGFHQNLGGNVFSNILLSPTNNPGMIQTHRGTAYSPAMGHIPQMGVNHRQPNMQMTTHTEITTDRNTSCANPSSMTTGRNVSRDLQSPQRPTTTGTIINTNVHVKRQTSSVNSCTAPVIISDSDDDDEQPTTSTGGEKKVREQTPSLPAKQDFTRVVIDDDIEITGMRAAEIMSHMRSDCPIHQFKRVDNVDVGPQEQNASKCIKCFCYVCDKVATECKSWTTTTFPHCNAHSRASCWKARRNTKKSPLMLRLASEEVTQEMEQAGEIAMQYMITIRESYITYRAGTPCEYNAVPCNCSCHKLSRANEPCHQCKVVHDMKKKFNYEPVRETALGIIREIQSKYSQSRPEMALITLEAVLSELCSQRPADFNHSSRTPSNPDIRCQCNFPNIIEEHIEKELVEILTRFEVSQPLRTNLVQCVEEAIRPLQLKDTMKKFLGMRHWDNLLLRAVLTGANTTGSKGREVLRETADVIKMRVEKLDRDKRYHSILRYIKVVKLFQNQSSGISGTQIVSYMEQWMLLYKAKQGLFKDVAFRLTEFAANEHRGCILSTLPPEFLIKLLDVLAGYDISPDTRLDAFDPAGSRGPYEIKGKDADVLLMLFVFIVQQNPAAANHVPIYLWLAKWVNRSRLSPCLDPNLIKPWVDQGTTISELAKQASIHGQCGRALIQCQAHDPHVHLFLASASIVNAVAKLRKSFTSEHIQVILDAYKTNEWALFHLVTQSAMMSFGDLGVIRWITNFCEKNSGSIAQIKDRVLIESIQPYPLDNVSELLNALIKPDWVTSVDAIQQTVIAVASEYSIRLLEELKRYDAKVLILRSKWLEEIILKNVEERKISPSLLRDERVINQLKNVSKTCSFVNPVKHNIDLYKKISPSAEWYRRCNQLLQFLQDKFSKYPFSGTMEEFSSLLWLLWSIGDIDRLKARLVFFEDRHSCDDDGVKVTSLKVIRELAGLLDSSAYPDSANNKHILTAGCIRLCVVETLSWLTCAECASKMPTGWGDIWVSIAQAKLTENFESLNQNMIEQFKKWLNQVPLDNPNNYQRLTACLRTFLSTLVLTWMKCSMNLDRVYRLLMDVSAAIAGQTFQRDFASLSAELIKVEKDKLQPKILETIESQPPNNIQIQTQVVRQSRSSVDQAPVQSEPQHTRQYRSTSGPPGPPPSLTISNDLTPKRTTTMNDGVAKQILKKPPEVEKIIPPTNPSPQREELRASTAVMSTDALFKKTPTNKAISPQKSASTLGPQKGESQKPSPQKDKSSNPFSSLNRTKTCQSCGETISCASFRCPKCNQAARSVQPVTCPGCGQENREMKGYSCQYCYRSLLDVLFQGGEGLPVSLDEPKIAEVKQNKRKKKSEDKRRKKSKNDGKPEKKDNPPERNKSLSENSEKKVLPVTLKVQHKTLEDSSDSDLNDFVTEKPRKKRKRHVSMNSKVPPLKLKRKPSIISSPPRVVEPANVGVSLTDEESDTDENGNNALIISSDEFYVDPSKAITEKTKITTQKSSESRSMVPAHNSTLASPEKSHLDNMGKTPPIPKPQFFNNVNNKHQSDAVSPQKVRNTHNPPVNTHNAPAKRGVGHSSMMSKKQKDILSRIKRPGMGPKVSTSTKITPPNSSNKDIMRSPSGYKRSSLDNGPMSSPIRGQNELTCNNEKQRNDSSCSSGSVSSSASALSFGLASVEQKSRPRNVGHRTGGPPSSKKYETSRSIIDENVASNSKKTLFPKPLNSKDSKLKKKKKKKHKDRPTKKITLTERKLDSMISKRKPGPASLTGYHRLLKLSHKLKKLQRTSPHKLWRLSSSVTFPSNADLSRYAQVTLTSFPAKKLIRIRKLVPNYSIEDLYG